MHTIVHWYSIIKRNEILIYAGIQINLNYLAVFKLPYPTLHTLLFHFYEILLKEKSSLVPQLLKRLPAMRETRVQSLGWEDPLEKETATNSSTLTWKIPWMEHPGGLWSMGSRRVGHD